MRREVWHVWYFGHILSNVFSMNAWEITAAIPSPLHSFIKTTFISPLNMTRKKIWKRSVTLSAFMQHHVPAPSTPLLPPEHHPCHTHTPTTRALSILSPYFPVPTMWPSSPTSPKELSHTKGMSRVWAFVCSWAFQFVSTPCVISCHLFSPSVPITQDDLLNETCCCHMLTVFNEKVLQEKTFMSRIKLQFVVDWGFL